MREIEDRAITDIFPMHFRTLKATFCTEMNTPNSQYGFLYEEGQSRKRSKIASLLDNVSRGLFVVFCLTVALTSRDCYIIKYKFSFSYSILH